ncbi:MAG: PKD domain-containing protein [Candidatus Komeilibacteria bacterium]|jgi:PKD repeat protein|nr:PKD domain-containing protein [Candidatus Komeilibacteria bacterium]MBT4447203.1 PKD domain-containing protein [Candidatus Komeilibacteria bacterium]
MWRKAILLFILLFCFKVQASEIDLVISEIMYDVDGGDAGHEWVEIFNSGPEEITVSSTWRFFDGSNHNINFYQGTTTIASQEFFVLADDAEQFLLDYPDLLVNVFDTVMSLPNSSSSIALSFDEGLNYDLEESYDNAWGAGDGYSLEKTDLLATSTDNWQVSLDLGGTPGQINSEGQVDDPPAEDDPPEEDTQAWSQLIINEFLPNPVGSDTEEWIELYNQGPEILNLDGLKIKDNSTRIFTLDLDSGLNLQILANNYLLLSKDITGISLNNSNGDAVIIMDDNQSIIQEVNYSQNATEGRAYARSEDGFVWTKTPTPGQVNQISINQPPIAQISVEDSDFLLGQKISFSAESSYDPEVEDLDYLWEFGDDQTSSREKIKHSFENLGSYTIRLTVTDTEGASDWTEFTLDINQIEEILEDSPETEIEEIDIVDLAEDDLIISEFIPNPEGSDDNEWIELYNATDRDINLYAWQLDDQDGGSKPYQFSTSTIILTKKYLLLNRKDTKITLNNSSDSVRLLDHEDNIYQEITYEKIPEGKSYAWDSENNEWTINEPSPGIENIFVQNAIQDQGVEVENSKIIYGVAEVKDLDKNQEIIVQGVVINSVNSDDRSLFLADYNFSESNFEELVEIYFYYKDWPDIKAGQLITIQGKISKLGDLPRIKIKAAQDIWQNDVEINLLEPDIMEVEDIDEDSVGSLVNVKGIVVKKSGKNIYLASDIEEDYLLRIYSRFSTKDLEIKKGNEILVAGILSHTDSGFKLVPFSIGDIAVSKQVLGAKIEANKNMETEISTSTSQVIMDDRKNNIKKALVFIIAGFAIISLIYFIKKKRTPS